MGHAVSFDWRIDCYMSCDCTSHTFQENSMKAVFLEMAVYEYAGVLCTVLK